MVENKLFPKNLNFASFAYLLFGTTRAVVPVGLILFRPNSES